MRCFFVVNDFVYSSRKDASSLANRVSLLNFEPMVSKFAQVAPRRRVSSLVRFAHYCKAELLFYLSFIVYCRFGQVFYYVNCDTRSRNRFYFDDELVRRLGKRHSDCRFLTSCFSYRQNCLVVNNHHCWA